MNCSAHSDKAFYYILIYQGNNLNQLLEKTNILLLSFYKTDDSDI